MQRWTIIQHNAALFLLQNQPAEGVYINNISSHRSDISKMIQQPQYPNRNRNKDHSLNFTSAKNEQEKATCRRKETELATYWDEKEIDLG